MTLQEISFFQIKLHSIKMVIRFWSSQNSHWFQETHTQNPQKVNVWVGLVGGCVVGSFFIGTIRDFYATLYVISDRMTQASA
ncbi:hypothetical protein NQ318_019389 [Aromia moschata]|uniref:Uncharacterized protein n=1 Tax=Aromia moschata TaxID=1265417 RepID=A0AAV8XE76_9CUCU|nr:hypothetical protein NQ318_019389 [Aromia moschata]